MLRITLAPQTRREIIDNQVDYSRTAYTRHGDEYRRQSENAVGILSPVQRAAAGSSNDEADCCGNAITVAITSDYSIAIKSAGNAMRVDIPVDGSIFYPSTSSCRSPWSESRPECNRWRRWQRWRWSWWRPGNSTRSENNARSVSSFLQDSFRANAIYLYADSRGVARRLVVTRGTDERFLMAQYVTERGLQARRAIAVLHEVALVALDYGEQLRHPKSERVRPARMIASVGSHSWASLTLPILRFLSVLRLRSARKELAWTDPIVAESCIIDMIINLKTFDGRKSGFICS